MGFHQSEYEYALKQQLNSNCMGQRNKLPFLIISSEGSAYNRLISNSETQLSQCILQDLIQKFIMCLLEFIGQLMKVLLVALIQVLVNPWEMNESLSFILIIKSYVCLNMVF